MAPGDVTLNSLAFDREKRVYILTGANRGGKTTVTQAVGQLFLLAQGAYRYPRPAFSSPPRIRCSPISPPTRTKRWIWAAWVRSAAGSGSSMTF